MYRKVAVAPLSVNQMRNMVSGRGVRVKHSPTGKHQLMLSAEQMKRMARAHGQGKGITIIMDPYQQDQHKQMFGGSILGKKFDNFMVRKLGQDKKDKLYGTVNKFGKPLAKKGIAKLSQMATKLGLDPRAISSIENIATDYIEDPGRFQTQGFMSEFGKSGMKGLTAPKEMATGEGRRRRRGGALFPAGRY